MTELPRDDETENMNSISFKGDKVKNTQSESDLIGREILLHMANGDKVQGTIRTIRGPIPGLNVYAPEATVLVLDNAYLNDQLCTLRLLVKSTEVVGDWKEGISEMKKSESNTEIDENVESPEDIPPETEVNEIKASAAAGEGDENPSNTETDEKVEDSPTEPEVNEIKANAGGGDENPEINRFQECLVLFKMNNGDEIRGIIKQIRIRGESRSVLLFNVTLNHESAPDMNVNSSDVQGLRILASPQFTQVRVDEENVSEDSGDPIPSTSISVINSESKKDKNTAKTDMNTEVDLMMERVNIKIEGEASKAIDKVIGDFIQKSKVSPEVKEEKENLKETKESTRKKSHKGKSRSKVNAKSAAVLPPLVLTHEKNTTEAIALAGTSKASGDTPKDENSPYFCKYYEISKETKDSFWSRKPTPPKAPKIYPKGHPMNKTGEQTVWTASSHEIEYYVQRRYLVETITEYEITYNGQYQYYQHKTKPIMLTAKYTFQLPSLEPIQVDAMLLQNKMKFLEQLAASCKNIEAFWTRCEECFGSTLSEIAMSLAQINCRKVQGNLFFSGNQARPRVLICAGNNFQGASCLAAARYIELFGSSVWIYSLERADGKEEFPGIRANSLKSLKHTIVVHKLSDLDGLKFKLVVLAMDDYSSPNVTIYLYRRFLKDAAVVLVDPPAIGQSYKSLIEGIIKKQTNSSSGSIFVRGCIIYGIRPSLCSIDEELDIFVVNLATTASYPAVGPFASALLRPMKYNIPPGPLRMVGPIQNMMQYLQI